MHTRTASMLVMAAGMAWVMGCAEWRDDRADSGYRTIDGDARDRRTDVRPGATDTTRPGLTEDAQRGGYVTSGNPQGATTAPAMQTDGTAPRTAMDGRAAAGSGATQDARGSSPYSPANRGTVTSTTSDSDPSHSKAETRAQHDRHSDGRTSDWSGASGTAASTDKSHTQAETRAQHDRHTDGRTSEPASATTTYPDRSYTKGETRDAYDRHDDGRAGAREDRRASGEDQYGISPDAFGSSPYSPANRGVRVVKYDRRAIEPLQRETSWQSPGGPAVATSTWPENRSTVDNRTVTNNRSVTDNQNGTDKRNMAENRSATGAQGRSSDLARMDTQDQSRAQSEAAAGRDAAWREGYKPDALAAQPGPDGKPAIDAALVGVSPDSRILSILHAKDAEEVEMGRLARNKGGSADVRRFGEELERDHSDHGRKVEALANSRNIMLLEADQLKELMKRDMAKKADGTGYTDRHDYNQAADERAEQLARDAATREAGEEARAGRTDTPPDRTGKDATGKDATGKDVMGKDSHKDHKDRAAVMAELNGLSGSEFDRRFAEVMLKGHRELIQKVEKCRQDVTPEVGQFLDQTLTTLRKHEQTAERLADAR